MSYYTIENLENFFRFLIDDIKYFAPEDDNNDIIITHSGLPSPIENIVCMSGLRHYDHAIDSGASHESAQLLAHLNWRPDVSDYLDSTIESDDPYEVLDSYLYKTSHSLIQFNRINSETVFYYLSVLPIEWVHERILNK